MPIHIDVILKNKVLGPAFRRRLKEESLIAAEAASKEARERALREGRQEGLQTGRQEGLQTGLQEGRQEGRQEGESSLLRRLLEFKFGPLPADVELAIQSAPEQTLKAWFDKALTATTLDEIFRPS